MNEQRSVQLDPYVADEVPWSEEITSYDEEHFVTYLRLLDAMVDGADWSDVTRVVLHRDPGTETEQSRHCWESHLARARWLAAKGYRQLLVQGAEQGRRQAGDAGE